MPALIVNNYDYVFSHRDFGAWLRHNREMAEMTQQEVAELVGVHQTTITGYERGRHLSHDAEKLPNSKVPYSVSMKTFLALVNLFEGNPHEFFVLSIPDRHKPTGG